MLVVSGNSRKQFKSNRLQRSIRQSISATSVRVLYARLRVYQPQSPAHWSIRCIGHRWEFQILTVCLHPYSL